jgi:hypothetical protein
MPVTEPSQREEIGQLIKEINQAWLEGRPEDLEKYFHQDVVFVFPNFHLRLIRMN